MSEELCFDPFGRIKPGSEVMVAFSGGVDSSVAAYLCKKAGLKVKAVTMRLLGKGPGETAKAERMAELLDLDLEIVDLQEAFEQQVLRRTWEEYAGGRTPNPCTICNPVFKFGVLADFARAGGCSALVTGHYARIGADPQGRVYLKKGLCAEKDQSYFLFGLRPEQLEYACFPLGDLQKSQVRQIARELELPCAEDKESQDACFAPQDNSNMAEMLRCRFHAKASPGNFLGMDGSVLGKHCGIHAYTIGQRKGTGVAMGKPAYVKEIRAEDRSVILTTDPGELLSGKVLLKKANILAPDAQGKKELDCFVKIRYRSQAVPAHIVLEEDSCIMTFETPQRAVTPGQAAVFYDDRETLLGGSYIDRTLS